MYRKKDKKNPDPIILKLNNNHLSKEHSNKFH